MWALVQEPCDENVIRSAPETAPCAKSRGPWILAATILASSMAFIDGTAVNVALPALQTNLNATAVDVQWVIEAYSLLLSALLLVGGSLGDHYGRRRVFLIGIALFAFASAACGFAANIHQLIAARAFAGTWRGAPCSGQSRYHQQFVFRGPTRTRHRHLVRPQRHHNRTRPGDGRLAYRTRIMARSVLY